MDVKLVWGGWNTDGTSDKVWGIIQRCKQNDVTKYNDNVYVFWGARGKSMQFKDCQYDTVLTNLVRTKMRKGYNGIDYTKLLEIWPDFEDTLRQRFTFHLLVNS